MQVTYDSVPEGGVDSSSAFRMVVSPTLRPNDLGVLVTGAPYSTKHDGLVSDLRIPKHVDEVRPQQALARLATATFVEVVGHRV